MKALKITSILISDGKYWLPFVGLVGDEFFSFGTLFDRFIFQSMPVNSALLEQNPIPGVS
jgi:hypothetical protein